MEDIKQLIKVAGPKMVPFIKSVTIYFLLVSFEHSGKIWSTILKCAPIICLMIFAVLYGVRFTKEYSYAHKILIGLIFSCAGDALLNLNLFIYGMGMFSIAQIFYIIAFGFKPLKIIIGILLYFFGAITVSILYENLDDIIKIGLPIYTILLLTMCWRALARVDQLKDYSNISTIASAVGSLLFVISDGLIGVDRFYSPIPHSTIWIMTTYYAAQFGITLSIVNIRDDQLKQSIKEKKILEETDAIKMDNGLLINNIGSATSSAINGGQFNELRHRINN